MNAIWKAPWGRHIDLSRIVEVIDFTQEEALNYSSNYSFGIIYQLRDEPVFVNRMSVGPQFFTTESEWSEMGDMIKHGEWHDMKRFHEELISAWWRYKSEL